MRSAGIIGVVTVVKRSALAFFVCRVSCAVVNTNFLLFFLPPKSIYRRARWRTINDSLSIIAPEPVSRTREVV